MVFKIIVYYLNREFLKTHLIACDLKYRSFLHF